MPRNSKWIRVSKRRKCRICSRPDWCTFAPEIGIAICMRTPSRQKKTFRDGSTGYVHKINGDHQPQQFIRDEQPRPKRLTLEEVNDKADMMFGRDGAAEKRQREAKYFGVHESVLESMHVGLGFDKFGREFSSWPSRDGKGKIVGIIRRYGDGKKLTLPGTSNAGVFIGKHWFRRDGPLYIVEGGSDTAALLQMNACVIGRPSNTGGLPVIRQLIARRATGREIIVVGEIDRRETPGHEECPGCPLCWPGLSGCRALMENLMEIFDIPVRLKLPSGTQKDVREMLSAGTLGDWLANNEHLDR